MEKISNLVLEGGGVKGLAYVGALKVLFERGHLATIKHLAGTSAGAITALIVGLGYSLKEIEEILNETDINEFRDGPKEPVAKGFNIYMKWGINPGKAFETWIQNKIKQKLDNPYATFADLHHTIISQGETNAPFCFRDVHIIGANLASQLPETFSYYTTPDMPLYMAVRISMAIPIFFTPKILKKDEKGNFIYDNKKLLVESGDGEMYVDGGLIDNFPIHLFDTTYPNPETLGIKLDTPTEVAYFKRGEQMSVKPISTFKAYGMALINAARSAQHRHYEMDLFRTIYIDTGHIKTKQFNLNENDKSFLKIRGEDAAIKFFGMVYKNPFSKLPGHKAYTDKLRLEKLDLFNIYQKSSSIYYREQFIQLTFALTQNENFKRDELELRVKKYTERLRSHVGIYKVQHYRQVNRFLHIINLTVNLNIMNQLEKWLLTQGEDHSVHNKLIEAREHALILLSDSISSIQPRWMLSYQTKLQAPSKQLYDYLRTASVKEALNLIHAGTSLDYLDDTGNTLLHVTVETGQAGLVKELINRGLKVSITNTFGDTVLHKAVSKVAKDNDADAKVLAVLLQSGASVNQQNVQENTPLMLAAANGYMAAVDLLLKYGADPSIRSVSKKFTALSKAIHFDHQAIQLRLQQVLAQGKISESQDWLGESKANDAGQMTNEDYWYTAEDIDKLLKLQLQDGCEVEIYAGLFPFLNNTKGKAASLFKKTLFNILTKPLPSIIPINLLEEAELDMHGLSSTLSGTHWIGLIIRPVLQNESHSHEIMIIDSLGNGFDQDKEISALNLLQIRDQVDETHHRRPLWEKISRLLGLLQGLIIERHINCRAQVIVTGANQQTNGTDCGAYVIQNLVSVIKENNLCNQSGQQLRKLHSELLGISLQNPNTLNNHNMSSKLSP